MRKARSLNIILHVVIYVMPNTLRILYFSGQRREKEE